MLHVAYKKSENSFFKNRFHGPQIFKLERSMVNPYCVIHFLGPAVGQSKSPISRDREGSMYMLRTLAAKSAFTKNTY